MYKILEKKNLNNATVLMKVLAPLVAKSCLPGQFIILRVNEDGERFPLTIADFDRKSGIITIIFQVVGLSTLLLSKLNVNDCILDICGPLGVSSHLDNIKKAVVIGGGLGCAIAYPQAKALFNFKTKVDIIAGFRNKELVILEKEMQDVCDNFYIMTDDGSYGQKGLVTNKLEQLLIDNIYDTAIVIGPLVMMKFVCLVTKKFNLKTIVSMNSIMIDGTGMCGCCRLTVDGKIKFACVDGPDFDGHLVDFDEAIARSKTYLAQEKESFISHECNLLKGKQL